MTTFRELAAFFPGPFDETKQLIVLDFKHKMVSTGAYILKDPIQVQELVIPRGQADAFMKHLKSISPHASKTCFFGRIWLEKLLKNFIEESINDI